MNIYKNIRRFLFLSVVCLPLMLSAKNTKPLRLGVAGVSHGHLLFYADLGEMLDKTKPEVVVVYGSIYDHLSVVEACAPHGILIKITTQYYL